jgi:formate dehydrogenase major subunit
VFIPFAYVEAAANLLTNPALDPFGKIPEFKYCAARVETATIVSEAAEKKRPDKFGAPIAARMIPASL